MSYISPWYCHHRLWIGVGVTLLLYGIPADQVTLWTAAKGLVTTTLTSYTPVTPRSPPSTLLPLCRSGVIYIAPIDVAR